MTAGRKPKPLQIHKLHGTYRPDRHNDQWQPEPDATPPSPPEFLNDVAAAEWQRLAPHLHASGLLTPVDYALFAAICTAYARWTAAEEQVTWLGAVVKSTSGEAIINPWLGVANKALEQMHRMLVEFGMTPSSRSRVDVPAPPRPSGVAKRQRRPCVPPMPGAPLDG